MKSEANNQDVRQKSDAFGGIGTSVRRHFSRLTLPLVTVAILLSIGLIWVDSLIWRDGIRDAVIAQERTWGRRMVEAESGFLQRRLAALETSLRRFSETVADWQENPVPGTMRLNPRGQGWFSPGGTSQSEILLFAPAVTVRDVVARIGGDSFDPSARGLLLVDPSVEAAGVVTFSGGIRRLPPDRLEDRIRDRDQLLNLRQIRESARMRGRATAWYPGGSLSTTPPAQPIGVAHPVMLEGNMTAVVFAELDATTLLPRMNSASGEWTILVDGSGTLIAADSLGGDLMGRPGSRLTTNPQRSIAAFGNRLLEKSSGEWEVATRRGTWLCSYVTLTQQNWKLVLARPTGLPEGAAKRLTRNGYITASLFSLFLLGLLIPVRELVKRRGLRLGQRAQDVIELLTTSIEELGHDTPLSAAGEERFPELQGLLEILSHKAHDLSTSKRDADRERDRLATILRSLDVGVAVMDRRFTVVYANDVILARHGDKLVGKRASWIVEENAWEGASDAKEVMEDGSPRTRRKMIPTGGEERYHQVTYFPIVNTPGGRVEGFGEVTTDVTELAHLQQKLETLASDLKDKNDILNQTNESLSKLDRQKSEFIGHVSHELRIPMKEILESLHSLLRDTQGLEDSTRATLQTVEASAKRLTELIEAQLELTRLDAGSIELRVAAFPILELLDDLLEKKRSDLDAKGLKVARSYPLSDLIIHQDAERLAQVINALLNNAIQFTDKGEVGLEVNRDGEMLDITVRDTGSGIPSDELAHIFERFHQAEGTVTRRHGGIGLGLTLALRMTEMLGGTLHVDSADGEGSSFKVRIPRDR